MPVASIQYSYVPVSFAPLETIFSQSGLTMKPNRARLADKRFEELAFLECSDTNK